MKKIHSFLIIIMSFSLLTHVSASENCTAWQRTEVLSNDLIIGEIKFNVANIFNLNQDKENKNFHKYANKWHVTTKQKIIARELLFKVGDQYNPRLLQETERLIRAKSFIKAAEIYATEICGNKVIIQVDTKDNWTLNPGISYGRTGGKTKWAFELQEKNLFGLGKSLEFKYKKGIDRTRKSIKYNDDNLFGSRNQLDVVYENNSDGKLNFINLYRPFFSLDSPNAWGVQYFDNELITPLYERGEVIDEIGQNHNFYSLSYGKLVNRTNDGVHRYNFGYTSDKSDFFASNDFPNAQLPNSRTFQYPWISYEYFKEDYIEKTNFNSMGRQEDISLGHRFRAQIGNDFSGSSLHYDFSYSKGLFAKDNNLVVLDAFFNGIYQDNDFLNSHLGVNLKWFHFQSHNKTFFASVNLDKASNLFPENRQYLGGDNGLRGYPLRYLHGENKVNITLEQRFFYNWYPLKTFQFASAIFLDTGAAWDDNFSDNHVTNVGVGFRLVPTRTSSGKVIHLDFAIPINDRDIIGNYQIQIRTKKSF